MSWRLKAACIDEPSEWWLRNFPTSIAKAKEVCASCPVRSACLEEQVLWEEYAATTLPGVYGGLTRQERHALHMERGMPSSSLDGITLPWPKSGQPTRHGSWHAYKKYGCRCVGCRTAADERQRRRNANNRDRKAATRSELLGCRSSDPQDEGGMVA